MPKRHPRLFLPVITAFFLCAVHCFAIEEILTTDGQKFTGTVVEDQADFVVLEMDKGVQVRIDKSEIVYRQPEDKTNLTKQEYFILGGTFGLPTPFNFVGGYYWKDVGFKLAGAYWPGTSGIQVDLSKKLADSKNALGNLSLVAGHISGDIKNANGDFVTDNWNYAGIGGDVNWGGFALELDIVNGPGNIPGAFLWQAGYVQRFN
jgi:hypothetical protein